jgi:streptogramin lyase
MGILRGLLANRWRKALAASAAAAGLAVGGVLVPAAAASTPTATLHVQPAAIYYPCSEGNVTFSVTGFPASSQVALYIGTTKATPAGYMDTNSSGEGQLVLSFSNYYPGDYLFIASSSGTQAKHYLEVGECP